MNRGHASEKENEIEGRQIEFIGDGIPQAHQNEGLSHPTNEHATKNVTEPFLFLHEFTLSGLWSFLLLFSRSPWNNYIISEVARKVNRKLC